MKKIDDEKRLEIFAGYGVSGYRSFTHGEDISLVGPIGKVHLIIGKNNAGKSNALLFLTEVLSALDKSHQDGRFLEYFSHELDLYDESPAFSRVSGSIGLRTEKLIDLPEFADPKYDSAKMILRYLSSPDDEGDVIWFPLQFVNVQEEQLAESKEGEPPYPDHQWYARDPHDETAYGLNFIKLNKLLEKIDVDLLNQAVQSLNGGTFSQPIKSLAFLIGHFKPWRFLPDVVYVSSPRQLQGDNTHTLDSDKSLAAQLFELKNPSGGSIHAALETFGHFEHFVRGVLEDDSLEVVISEGKEEIHIKDTYSTHPIDRLGAGISEIIALAAYSTIHNHKLLCVEEPETHIHPELQRKLITYMANYTTNRYLISTHSSALLNTGLASISHVVKTGRSSRIEPAISKSELSRVARDLGALASDLLQTNYIVWVEGPSDRIYIKHWLRLTDADLKEHIHFVVMAYGGSLLSYLTATEEQDVEGGVAGLVELLSINRNFSIVIDSDKTSQKDEINETKRRLICEVNRLDSTEDKRGARVWKTDGYTIENYLTPEQVREAVAAAHPNVGLDYTVDKDDFTPPLQQHMQGGKTPPNKVKVALKIAENTSQVPEDAQEHIRNMAARIRSANGMPSREK